MLIELSMQHIIPSRIVSFDKHTWCLSDNIWCPSDATWCPNDNTWCPSDNTCYPSEVGNIGRVLDAYK